MPNGRDIVVIGASSGGVEALMKLVGGLREDLPAAVLVVNHLRQEGSSVLPKILDRAGPLEALRPEDGEPIKKGRVYVAAPDYHMLVEDGRVRMARGPKENLHRPAVDPLFRSAAIAYGPRVVGVILTGAQSDGTSGLLAVKRCGGVAVVQDPEEALFDGMPQSALEYVEVDHCLPLDEIAPLLARLSGEDVPAQEDGAYATVPEHMEFESKMAGLDPAGAVESGYQIGEISHYTCPECTGPLFEIRDGVLLRYRCRVGHAYTAQNMLDEKAEVLEEALYTALNTLEESASMSRRLAGRAREQKQDHAAGRFEERVRKTAEQGELIRRALKDGAPDATEEAI
jgi:two-component system chemotaxis response regulator CheB